MLTFMVTTASSEGLVPLTGGAGESLTAYDIADTPPWVVLGIGLFDYAYTLKK